MSRDTAPIRQEQETTIVSTFGLWDGEKIHEWGRGGIRGVRLISTEIHKGKINLSFGNEGETTWAELMHGITNKEEALYVKEKPWRETGVTATIRRTFLPHSRHCWFAFSLQAGAWTTWNRGKDNKKTG